MTDKSKKESKEGKTNEWTFTKIITRLVLYPVCLVYLWYAITYLLPNSISSASSIKGVLGVIVTIFLALIYPISDLLILLGKDKGDK